MSKYLGVLVGNTVYTYTVRIATYSVTFIHIQPFFKYRFKDQIQTFPGSMQQDFLD